MGRIVISQNVTVDGVVEDPTGEDGTERGGWFARVGDADRAAWAEAGAREAEHAEALLLGRRTYAWLAARWTARTGPWAERLAGMPKYVVSSTLDHPGWPHTTVLAGDPLEEAAQVRRRLDGDVVVNGSGRLAHALLRHGLVDELRLMVFPSVLGGGDRMFPALPTAAQARLGSVERVGDGLVLLTYDVLGGRDQQ